MTSISKKAAMDKKEVIEYIETVGYAEIPSIQRKFKLSYRQVRDIVAELTADKRLVYKGGIRYDSTVVSFSRADGFDVSRVNDKGQSRVRIIRSDPAINNSVASDNSDREAQMNRLLRELSERRLNEIRRQLSNSLEPEVREWLTNAFIADKDLTLSQAAKQARSELTRAKKSGTVGAVLMYTNVVDYLSTCDSLTFEQLKKSLLPKP